MIVVSDTSCISNLLTVGEASLLPHLFGEVLIPPAVERELRRFHSDLPEFLKCRTPKDQSCTAVAKVYVKLAARRNSNGVLKAGLGSSA